MALKIEDVRVGDLASARAGDFKVMCGPVKTVTKNGLVRIAPGDGPLMVLVHSGDMQRPPLEPGMWARPARWEANQCTREIGENLLGTGRYYYPEGRHKGAHGDNYGGTLLADWIPVAPPPGAEDTSTTAPATGETPASVEGEGAGPSVKDPSPVHFHAKPSPCCVRCQGNPMRTNCKECTCWGSNADGHTDADCPQSDERRDEPDPTRWDRCQEGRVFVRGDVVITCREGDWFVRRGGWESWDGYLTPRAAAEWAEHLPERR